MNRPENRFSCFLVGAIVGFATLFGAFMWMPSFLFVELSCYPLRDLHHHAR